MASLLQDAYCVERLTGLMASAVVALILTILALSDVPFLFCAFMLIEC